MGVFGIKTTLGNFKYQNVQFSIMDITASAISLDVEIRIQGFYLYAKYLAMVMLP